MRSYDRRHQLALLGVLVGALLGLGAWIVGEARTDDAPDGSGGSATAATLDVVAPEVAAAAIDDGAVPMDVRTPGEFDTGHLVDAVNLDSADPGLAALASELDPQQSYVVYCESGRRAAEVIERLEDDGFTQLLNGGGYDALAASGLVETVVP